MQKFLKVTTECGYTEELTCSGGGGGGQFRALWAWGNSGVILVRVCEPFFLKTTPIINLVFEKKTQPIHIHVLGFTES